MAIPRVKQNWVDGSSGNTPLSAARMNDIEQGIFDAHYMPAVRVFHNAAQSTTTGVDFTLAFNSDRFDQASNASDTMHDTVTNNSRLTCRYGGVYEIKGNVEFAANGTGSRVAKIKLNGTTVIAQMRIVAAASDNHALQVSCAYALALNDYVELVVQQSSGGALNVNSTGNYSPEFSMVRVA